MRRRWETARTTTTVPVATFAEMNALRSYVVSGDNVMPYSENLEAWSLIAPSTKQDAIVAGAAIADPSGGMFADTEARTAINAILATLRSKGIISA